MKLPMHTDCLSKLEGNFTFRLSLAVDYRSLKSKASIRLSLALDYH
jgi:hypothetical protein